MSKKEKKRRAGVDPREQTDPYYAMMKTEKEISSRLADTFDLDPEDYNAYMDKVERNIGRYPHGFRHYENYINYRVAKPEATL